MFAHHVSPHVVFDGGPVGAGGAVEGLLPRVGADVADEVAVAHEHFAAIFAKPGAAVHLLPLRPATEKGVKVLCVEDAIFLRGCWGSKRLLELT